MREGAFLGREALFQLACVVLTILGNHQLINPKAVGN